MSLNQEDDAVSDLAAPDFSELLDLPDVAFTGVEDLSIDAAVANGSLPPLTPNFLHSTEYERPDLYGAKISLTPTLSIAQDEFNWDFAEPPVNPYTGLEEPDYAKFENVSF